jgi:gas vesicle protein
VEDRTAIWLGALTGAIIGAAAGYLLFTERGRRLRADLEPRILDLITELGRAREAAVVARDTIAEAAAGARHQPGAAEHGAPPT